MPYIEQENLFDQLNPNNQTLAAVAANGTLAPVLRTEIEAFRCPSDAGESLNSQRQVGGIAMATSNYLGSNASDNPTRNRGKYTGEQSYKADGILWENSDLEMAAITDGTSNTIAIGERTWTQKSGNFNYYSGTIFGQELRLPTTNPDEPYGHYNVLAGTVRQINSATDIHSHKTYSSNHPTGTLFAFVDGSVHFINENIQFNTSNFPDTTLEYLVAIADGEVVGSY